MERVKADYILFLLKSAARVSSLVNVCTAEEILWVSLCLRANENTASRIQLALIQAIAPKCPVMATY